MNEAVDRVLEEREAMDRGFPAGVVMSGAAHLFLFGGVFLASWLGARRPVIEVAPGFAVQLPRGGGGAPDPDPAPAVAPPATTQPAPAPEPPAPAPPPKVIKPPKEEPRRGLPPPDAKKAKPKPEKSVTPPRSAGPAAPDRAAAARGAAAATGHTSTTPGVGLVAPPGVGVPDGTDNVTDWYLAAVQQKIWVNWARQVRGSFTQPVRVSFTILGDGTLEDGSVQILQPSDVQLIDLAAKRAIFTAAPFSPLPKTYGTNRITIQARFEPTP